MSYKNAIITVFMLSAILLGAWMTLSYRGETVIATQTTSLPDAYMEGVTSIVMNKQGKPRMILATPKLTHYAENDTTDLVAPQLTMYRNSPQPWYITSDHAKATQGTETVDFWDNVNIHHSADNKNPATLIKTTTLTVHPNKQVAETKDDITMVQPSTIVKATGMYADMNTGNINLLSAARGEYVPDES